LKKWENVEMEEGVRGMRGIKVKKTKR